MGLEYVDIFYSHRPDPETPIEETMGALADIVRQGKALYVGISNYDADQTRKALAVLKRAIGALLDSPSPLFNVRSLDGARFIACIEGRGCGYDSVLAVGARLAYG